MISSGLKPAMAFLRRKGEPSRLKSLEEDRALVAAFAERSGYAIVAEFSDEEGSDDDLMEGRGFAAMLKRIEANSVHTVIVARAASFARDPVVQAVGYAKLRDYGVGLLAADAPSAFVSQAATAQLVDHVLEVSANFDKAMRAAHLRGVGERLRTKFGPKHRKRYADMLPEIVILTKRLHQRTLQAGVRTTLREISAMLAEDGYLNKSGKPFHPEEIRRMIKGPRPRRGKSLG